MVQQLQQFISTVDDPVLQETFNSAPFSVRLNLEPQAKDTVELAQSKVEQSLLMKTLPSPQKDVLEALILLSWDCLDEGHDIVSELSDEDAEYLHCLMHRIEGDLPNCSYWLRRSSSHPLHEALPQLLNDLDIADHQWSAGTNQVDLGAQEEELASEIKQFRKYEYVALMKKIIEA